jgi:hypothetical protein
MQEMDRRASELARTVALHAILPLVDCIRTN